MSGVRATSRREAFYGEQGNRLPLLTRFGARDPLFPQVSILLPMEGAHNSTAFPDIASSPNTFTRYGSPFITTFQSPNGISSAAFLNSGDFIGTSSISAITFGSLDFAAESWIYPLSPATNIFGTERAIMAMWSAVSPGAQAWLLDLYNGQLRFVADININDNVLFSVPNVITQERWYHVAVTRQSSTVRLFVGGTQVASTSVGAGSIITGSNIFGIGGYNRQSGGAGTFYGYIGPTRVTKSLPRYTGSFTPETRFKVR